MRKKTILYSEAAYALGIVILALGTAFMERADFGMSMVVAPAYLLHLKLVTVWPWFSFGTAEYMLQAVLLIALCLFMRKVKKGYFFSFVTAVIYGVVLDAMMALVGFLPFTGTVSRVVFFFVGMLFCSVGVSLLFHTYISPEAYELVVKEVSGVLKKDIHNVKTAYDCCSCLIGIVLSFAFFGFGHFEGVKLGTIFCALVNGWLIGRCSKWNEKLFDFKDGLKFRTFFEK